MNHQVDIVGASDRRSVASGRHLMQNSEAPKKFPEKL
jgi:hypothetical protein